MFHHPFNFIRSLKFKTVRTINQLIQFVARHTWANPRQRDRLATSALAQVERIVFILSGVPIDDSGGGSRCTQFALELLAQDYGVVYLNQFPSYESHSTGVKISHPHLFTYALAEFDWHRFSAIGAKQLADKQLIALAEFPSCEYLTVIEELVQSNVKIVYDLIDDWNTTLGGSWYSPTTEDQIIQASGVLAASAPLLVERLERASPKPVMLLPNAVNTNIFDPTKPYERPSDLPLAEWTMLYTGALWGDWFDWDLLKLIAVAYPSAAIVSIGDYRGQAGVTPPNVHFLGLKPQSALPAYLAHATVTIIPWKINTITHATSPLKVYEYLAMHRPVIAPDIYPLRGIPGVWLASDSTTFLTQLSEARRSNFPTRPVDEFIRRNNWQVRVTDLMRQVDATLC